MRMVIHVLGDGEGELLAQSWFRGIPGIYQELSMGLTWLMWGPDSREDQVWASRLESTFAPRRGGPPSFLPPSSLPLLSQDKVWHMSHCSNPVQMPGARMGIRFSPLSAFLLHQPQEPGTNGPGEFL